jgi:hypothetical protein
MAGSWTAYCSGSRAENRTSSRHGELEPKQRTQPHVARRCPLCSITLPTSARRSEMKDRGTRPRVRTARFGRSSPRAESWSPRYVPLLMYWQAVSPKHCPSKAILSHRREPSVAIVRGSRGRWKGLGKIHACAASSCNSLKRYNCSNTYNGEAARPTPAHAAARPAHAELTTNIELDRTSNLGARPIHFTLPTPDAYDLLSGPFRESLPAIPRHRVPRPAKSRQ